MDNLKKFIKEEKKIVKKPINMCYLDNEYEFKAYSYHALVVVSKNTASNNNKKST